MIRNLRLALQSLDPESFPPRQYQDWFAFTSSSSVLSEAIASISRSLSPSSSRSSDNRTPPSYPREPMDDSGSLIVHFFQPFHNPYADPNLSDTSS